MPSSSYGAGGTVYLKFTTRGTTGLPTSLLGTPAVSIYKDASTTASVAGVTLTVDFNARTGLNHLTINTAADTTFYANGHSYWAVITAGTVGGTSVVGEVVGNFDLGTPAPVTDGTIYPLSGTVNLTAATSTTATLDAGASAVSQAYQWDVLNILTGIGAGQSRVITNYAGRVATVSPPWTTTPSDTPSFAITPTASVQVVNYVSGQDPASLVLNAQQSSYLLAGSIGASISNLDATVSSRLASASYTAAPTVAAIDTQLSGTHGAGSWLTAAAGLSLGQVLSAPRDVSAIPDNQLTVNDGLWAAIGGGVGKGSVDPVGLRYKVFTPATGTLLRNFAIDNATAPLNRT